MNFNLSSQQKKLAFAALNTRQFIEGPSGSGKTTIGVARLAYMLETGVPPDSILLLVPQRTLAAPYSEFLNQPGLPPGGTVDIVTLGGLAQRMVALFWPLIAEQAGFKKLDSPPIFLTLETAQYYMAQIINPLLDEGYFETVKIDRNRLFSQILDNLNKAAAVGFPYTEISSRLKQAWIGEAAQIRVYEDAQDCANRFREYCLSNNLLDFSLQLEVFCKHLWPSMLCREYLTQRYRHLIFDNVEEDVPVVHEIVREWLPSFQSATLIYDQGAGFRVFLGADPESGHILNEICDSHISLGGSWVCPPDIQNLMIAMDKSIFRQDLSVSNNWLAASTIAYHRFNPEMTRWVVDQIAALVFDHQVSPGEIVILSPFLSDSLRFSLLSGLNELKIPARSHRPSRSLKDEPVSQCLFTFAKLSNPAWGLIPSQFDIRDALVQAIDGLDLVRADLLSRITYKSAKLQDGLSSFDRIMPEMQDRISFSIGERFENLRSWLDENKNENGGNLDIFLSRLFGELLSQPGYGFHENFDAAAIAAQLIESIKKFRWVTEPTSGNPDRSIGKAYLEMVTQGVVAAQYLQSWGTLTENAVLVAPAYTFLMANRSAKYQFWLDVGSTGWWERLYQPLTHPYVLSNGWPENTLWTDSDEFESNQASLARLTRGLLRRCSGKVIFCTTKINEQGNEQRGPLLKSLQYLLRHTPDSPEVNFV